MVTALYFDVKFNKDIIKERFISPGSYVLLIDGKEISIDSWIHMDRLIIMEKPFM